MAETWSLDRGTSCPKHMTRQNLHCYWRVICLGQVGQTERKWPVWSRYSQSPNRNFWSHSTCVNRALLSCIGSSGDGGELSTVAELTICGEMDSGESHRLPKPCLYTRTMLRFTDMQTLQWSGNPKAVCTSETKCRVTQIGRKSLHNLWEHPGQWIST